MATNLHFVNFLPVQDEVFNEPDLLSIVPVGDKRYIDDTLKDEVVSDSFLKTNRKHKTHVLIKKKKRGKRHRDSDSEKIIRKQKKIASKLKYKDGGSLTIKMKITSKLRIVLPDKKFRKPLKKVKKPKAWKYTNIEENRYKGDTKRNKFHEPDVCDCQKVALGESGCGDDCINRMTLTECDPDYCINGKSCTNSVLQKKKYAAVQRYMTDGKGWGVRATKSLKEGTFVMEYTGEIVDEDTFEKRMETKYANDKHHYCMALGGGLFIDAHRVGSECRFVNHSCDPNCDMVKWTVAGQSRMALYTKRKIVMGEELSYDYNFDNFNHLKGQICKCGAKNCRGIIGGRGDMLNKICEIKMREKHLIHISKSKELLSIETISKSKKTKSNQNKMELTFKLWG